MRGDNMNASIANGYNLSVHIKEIILTEVMHGSTMLGVVATPGKCLLMN